MLHINAVLREDDLAELHAILVEGDWIDGRQTAGHLSAQVKNNRQLAEGSAGAARAGAIVTRALEMNPLFMSGALPARIVPPLFNRYGPGETYGDHIDGALRHAGGQRIRTDLSATLFLNAPEDYDGGELTIGEGSITHRVKLAAGDMLLYPATAIHRVSPVTQGERVAAFFWIQSIVRDNHQRQMLFDLDRTVQQLTAEAASDEAVLALTGHYHNLVRLWADG
ncbi:Fe2+-dependent dioxygenase [Sphingomonas montanisoli]|uniref:Fe2+-dependent dioxygenase n=1 Tax=Sphingomonas montanisoli TaxID=2606412 RepID=A0A5D9C5Z3_9SPHN|nr:Fe2+-dependent dioxygenase [Sphingomonas montanisoli]TZG27224.1 Fe2+-dependent dioxygenase [Sphingomonas montanisoli]